MPREPQPSPALAMRPMPCRPRGKVQHHGARLGGDLHPRDGSTNADERGVREESLHVGHKLADDFVMAHSRSPVRQLLPHLPPMNDETMTAQRRDRAELRNRGLEPIKSRLTSAEKFILRTTLLARPLT